MYIYMRNVRRVKKKKITKSIGQVTLFCFFIVCPIDGSKCSDIMCNKTRNCNLLLQIKTLHFVCFFFIVCARLRVWLTFGSQHWDKYCNNNWEREKKKQQQRTKEKKNGKQTSPYSILEDIHCAWKIRIAKLVSWNEGISKKWFRPRLWFLVLGKVFFLNLLIVCCRNKIRKVIIENFLQIDTFMFLMLPFDGGWRT